MKIGQYCQRQRCKHVESEQFWHAFASRGFVSDSWAFLLTSDFPFSPATAPASDSANWQTLCALQFFGIVLYIQLQRYRIFSRGDFFGSPCIFPLQTLMYCGVWTDLGDQKTCEVDETEDTQQQCFSCCFSTAWNPQPRERKTWQNIMWRVCEGGGECVCQCT